MVELILAIVALLAGLMAGFAMPGSCAVAFVTFVLLMYLSVIIEEHNRTTRNVISVAQDITMYSFVVLVGSAIGAGAAWVWQYPKILGYAFWAYALVAAGYAIARCCVGWHVGASAAVLTSFLGVGLLIGSAYNGNYVWVVLFVFAAGLWWGADSWRRANGLAINE